MYKFKQDLAMAYFDGCSKRTASRLLAREINLTPGLLDALREAKAAAPGRRVVIDGDVHAPFRAVVQALDACAMQGLEVAGIHTAEGLPDHD